MKRKLCRQILFCGLLTMMGLQFPMMDAKAQKVKDIENEKPVVNTVDKKSVKRNVPSNNNNWNKKVHKKHEILYEDVAKLKQGETYSEIYKYGSNGLAVVRIERPYGDKYGLIDKEGNVVVPLMYDNLGLNNHEHEKKFVWVEHQILRKVAKRNDKGETKNGYIDEKGELVIPLIYDGLSWAEEQGVVMDTDSLIRVRKDGKWGCIKPNGKEVLPCIYDEMDKFKYGDPSFVKKDGKYAFIDAQGNFITPFVYNTAGSFHSDVSINSNRATVSIDGRYGYIDWLGKEVIPLEYEKAYSFRGGLGGVVKNGKLGFIDRHGKVIIPFEYDPELKYGFREDVVSLVKKNGKWGAINKKNEQVVPFIYEYDGGYTSLGVSCLYQNIGENRKRSFFMSYGGDIYTNWNKELEKTDSVLASKGVAEGQYILGYKFYAKKDYKTAIDWFFKAAKQNHASAQYFLGRMAEFGEGREKNYIDAAKWYECAVKGDNASAMNRLAQIYYYGNLSTGKDKDKAFGLFRQAADQFDPQAMYFLGWMYEHGDAVQKSIKEATRYYRKSSQQGYASATKRLQELQIVK